MSAPSQDARLPPEEVVNDFARSQMVSRRRSDAVQTPRSVGGSVGAKWRPEHPTMAQRARSTAITGGEGLDARWLCIARAASIIDSTPGALRRALERRARRDADGVVRAELDGIRARKLGGRWRVLLGAEWLAGDVNDSPPRATSSARSTRAGTSEKE